MYRWIVFVHVLATFAFVLAHGASAKLTFRLRREANPERLAALLGFSIVYMTGVYVSLLVILLTGIAMSVLGNWRGQAWMWVALGLLMALVVAMGFTARGPLEHVREALAPPSPRDEKDEPRGAPAPMAEVLARVAAFDPTVVAVVGLGGLIVIILLMVFRPF